MNPVESFILEKNGKQQEIFQFLHLWILSKHTGIHTFISYGIPFYKLNRRLCYLNPMKNGDVDFVFLEGAKFINFGHLLNKDKRKQVGGYMVSDLEDIDMTHLEYLMVEAIELDQSIYESILKSNYNTKFK
jgi:hypothetical protein